jgi:cell wall-associated NlpC family hydrolase
MVVSGAPAPRRTIDPPDWIAPWIGLPYGDLGRGPAFDCWGLVREVVGMEFGVWLPSYDGRYADTHENAQLAALLESESARWQRIAVADRRRLVRLATEQPGDCLLFRQARLAGHVAVVAGGGWMVHIEEGLHSVTERYDEQPWAVRLIGIYRNPAIAGAAAARLGIAA